MIADNQKNKSADLAWPQKQEIQKPNGQRQENELDNLELCRDRGVRGRDLKELSQKTKELTDSKKALLNILEDVEVERRMAEEERDRTVAIIKNLADGIIILEKGMVTLFNPKAETFFFAPASEIIGQEIGELTKHAKVGRLFLFLQEKNLNLSREELPVGKDDLILEVSVVSIRGLGEETGKMIILHDVTREKAVEQMKTEFVSIAAHQLRTPLSAIKWIMNMMLEGDMGNISENQRDFLQKTYQSNERMISLVNDLLNVTRIEEGRFLYELTSKNIVALVEKIVAPLKEKAVQKGIQLIINKPDLDLPPIYIDEEKMSIAIQNLVDNAVNYTLEGKKITVTLGYDIENDLFLFKVQDEGIGIPADQQKRVFARFFRSPNAVRTETEGTGLGLFIAKNIIEAHHGRIWFESEEGQGSAFYFSVPRQPH